MGISGLFRDIYNLSYVLYYPVWVAKALKRLFRASVYITNSFIMDY